MTYHLRRSKDETHRSFFNKWDTAMRKVAEHRVEPAASPSLRHEEIHAIEKALTSLNGGHTTIESGADDETYALDESEAAEFFSTMLAKKTYATPSP